MIVDRIPRIQRQSEISRAEAGEHRSRVCRSASIFAARRCAVCRRWRGGPAIQMAGVAVRFATEQVVTSHLICGQRICGWVIQEGVEFRRKGADIRRSFILIKRLCPVSVDIACDGAVRRRQFNRNGVRTEHARPSWGYSSFLGAVRELNCIYGMGPDLVKERL